MVACTGSPSQFPRYALVNHGSLLPIGSSTRSILIVLSCESGNNAGFEMISSEPSLYMTGSASSSSVIGSVIC